MPRTIWFGILLVISSWAGSSPAQVPYLKVTDSATGEALYGVHVSMVVPGDSPKKTYEITDVKGIAKLPKADKLYITLHYLGYVTIHDTIEKVGDKFSRVYKIQEDVNYIGDAVVTGTHIPTKASDAVYNVKVIDRQRIESQGAVTLRDLLQNDLNVRITQDNILGTGIKLQGVGGENIKIMVDGVPLIGRLDGNIDLSQINLNNVERIEIIEGPASVNYGTNALGGVINIITKKKQNHNLEGGANLYYETVGQYNADAHLGWQFGKNLIQVSGGRYFFDGFTTQDSVKRFQDWKPKEQYFGDLLYNRKIGTLNLRYQGNIFREMIQSKGRPELPFYITASDQYFRTIRTTHSLFLEGKIKKRHHIDITASYAYYNRQRQSFLKDLVTLDQTLYDENIDLFNQWMSRGVYTYASENNKIRVQAGYDINVETAEGERIKDKSQWMGDFAGFLSAEYTPWKWITFKPGFRYGYNTKYATTPAPSMHVKITPVKGFDIRASYARGFRAPSIKELYFEFVDVNHNLHGNPDLKSEYSNNFNLQLTYNGEKNKFRYGIKAAGFYNDIFNQIRSVLTSVTPDSNVYRNENINRFQAVGSQLNVNFGYRDFDIALGASYNGVKNGLNDSAAGVNRFVFYPEATLQTSYNFRKWNGRFQVFLKYTGRQPILYSAYDETTQQVVIREGTISDFANLDISYTQKFFKNRFVVALFGKNLLNVTNIQQSSGISDGGAHSSGTSSLPTLWGATFGIALKYNFVVN